jgi:FAD/FMN-containing dehydrogenase
MLALSGLDTIQISADNSTVEVGPGLRWFDVYSYLEPYDRIVIGGRLKTIGVPGLTLIGGVHYFANKYGYAMDNVVSYDVVLGNGTQVTATANSSSDLFWALKGGANNFGVVTKFTLKTLAIPQVSTTIQVFNESGVQSFIKAACDLAQVDDASVAAGAVITINYNATTKVVSASLLGVQEGTESPPSRFANFSSIPADRVVNNVSSMATFAAQLDSPLQMFR